MITAGEGKYKVWLKREELDPGLVYTLGGGERSHIGGVVYKAPGREARYIDIEGHYDLEVLVPIADEACKKYDRPVVVTGGVHIDNATKDEIDLLVANCMELLKCI